MVLIAPSLLAADVTRLGDEVRALDAAGADWIHLDVMDNHFVPNLTFGPNVMKGLRPCSRHPFDVHLMASPADALVESFAEAGADILSVHPEASPHLHRTLMRIGALGRKAGVVLNPGTPAAAVGPVIDLVDVVLVMTVNPGFGGQAFLPSMLGKVAEVRRMLDAGGRPGALVEVDGGIDAETGRRAVEAGADVLVAGTSVFRAGAGYRAAIDALRGRA